ncbi:MAG: tRNA 4-thiouridine(8) synthase ThiI [Desulfobacterales bacterium]|nr:tRNA 4-thiouridine(8) synthase ThiI [Desulfobacterales bacterium]
MIDNKKKVCALGLCSGGLDSILSALVLRRHNVEVEWITFETPFFSPEKAIKASKTTGIPLTVKNITEEYLTMLKNPHCGYGRNMNPCMDCHSLMFRIAGGIMKESGFDFLFSGEVLGQRPMSQTLSSLRYVEKHSGYEGYIVRPLSAKRLPVTIPEKEGLINRELMLGFSGRSRKPQAALAGEFGISDYPNPAGGCLLTDKGFSRRLKDLFDHQKYFSENELNILKHGRHLRLSKNTKIIVGRNQSDNDNIEKLFNPASDILLKVNLFPGPTTVMPNGGNREIIILAASICAGYGRIPEYSQIDVTAKTPEGNETIKVLAIPPGKIRHLII